MVVVEEGVELVKSCVFLFVFVFGTGLKIFVKVVRVLVSGLGVEIAA